jgi:hypothetical protein
LLKVLRSLLVSFALGHEQENYPSFGRICSAVTERSVDHGLNSPSFVEAQSEQSNQNGNTTITIVNNNNNNLTMNDVKQHSCMRS